MPITKYDIQGIVELPLSENKPFIKSRGRKNTYLTENLIQLILHYTEKLESGSEYIGLKCKYTMEELETRFVITNIFPATEVKLKIESKKCTTYSQYVDPCVLVSVTLKYSDNTYSETKEHIFESRHFDGTRKYGPQKASELLSNIIPKTKDIKLIGDFDKHVKQIEKCWEDAKQSAKQFNENIAKKEKQKRQLAFDTLTWLKLPTSNYKTSIFCDDVEITNTTFEYRYHMYKTSFEVTTIINIEATNKNDQQLSEEFTFHNEIQIEDIECLLTEEIAAKVYSKYLANVSKYVPESNDGYRSAGYIDTTEIRTQSDFKQVKMFYLKMSKQNFKEKFSNAWWLEKMVDNEFCVMQKL